MTRRLLLAALIASLGCTKKQPPPAPPAAKEASAPAGADEAAAAGAAVAAEEELKPVYADFAGPPAPLAQKLCGALYDLPGARRAQCCGGKPAATLGGECVRIVSAALRSGGVQRELQHRLVLAILGLSLIHI
ncbi:MAG: hypothetical protein NVS2B9_22050 [Myxococcales bacterium]